MGWFSKLKSVVRQVVRVIAEAVGRVVGIADLLLGFVTWPPKKLRLHVAILSDANGPLVNEAELMPSLDHIKRVFKDRFNVKVVPYSKSFVEVVKTVFVIRNVVGKKGYSPAGPLMDYVLLDVDGVRQTTSTLAHEVGHACFLPHSGTQSNLMFKSSTRGDGAKWFQKNILRGSRHVLYW